MSSDFDDYLRRALPDEVDAPQHGEGFDERLWTRIERERTKPSAAGSVAAGARATSAWPRRVVALVAAVAAALAIAALLAGAPGRGSLSVAPASAEERALARINQGLASLSSLRATIVEKSGRHTYARYRLAVDADGSRRCEATYFPMWAQARQAWKEERALDKKQDQPLEPLDGKVEMRSLTTVDTRTRTFQARATYADVATKKTWGTAYGRTINAGTAELVDSEGPALLANVPWSDPAAGYLNTAYAVRAALESESESIRVEEVTWRGRPAYKMIGSGSSEWGMDAWIDRETGILLETLTPASDREPVYRTIVTSYSVDEPLARGLFTMKPAFDLRPDGGKPAPVRPRLSDYTRDLGSRTSTIAALPKELGYDPLVPASVPAGYRLTDVEVSGYGMLVSEQGGGWGYSVPDGYHIPRRGTLVYRKGLTTFIVRSAPTLEMFPSLAETPEEGTSWHETSQIEGYGNYVTLRHGYYAGFPVDMPRDLMGVWWSLVIARRPVGVEVSGGLTRAQLLGVLESLNPPGVRGDYRPPFYWLAWGAVAAALLSLAGICAVIAVRRRRGHESRVPFGLPGWVTVLGAAVTLLGVSLPWYAFLEAGRAVWVLRGREDTLGLTAAALAVAAVAAALGRTVLRRRLAIWATRLCVVCCGGLAAAAVLAATVYESPYALNINMKAPYQIGMYVSFAGALLLIAGGVFSSRRRMEPVRAAAAPQPEAHAARS